MDDGAPTWHLPVAEAFARSQELEAHGIPAPQTVQAVRALGLGGAPRTVAAAAEELRPLVPAGPAPVGCAPGPAPMAEPGARPGTPGEPCAGDGRGEVGTAVVRARGVAHAYRSVSGQLEPVLRGIDLVLAAGERIAL